MEPGSVLAFVLVTLRAAKVAHKILSSFKDASENVKGATAEVKCLSLALERLSTCRALEEHGGEALLTVIDACRKDIEPFAAKLTSLAQQTQSSRRNKYWRRFRAMWDEKALMKMCAKVARNTGNLNLYLNIILSNAVVNIPGRLESILTRESAAQQTKLDTHLVVLREQSMAIRAVDKGITTMGGNLEAAQITLQALSSLATSHFETQTLFSQMLQQLTGLSLGVQDRNRDTSRVKFFETRRSVRRISDNNWEQHRDVLLYYYHYDNKTLAEIMDLMETNYNFYATRRQYVHRFSKWNIRRYIYKGPLVQNPGETRPLNANDTNGADI